MVIAGLMVALVPPMFSGAVSGTKIKGAARDLAINLRETRSKAIIGNSEKEIQLDLDKQQYKIGDAKSVQLPENMAIDVKLITGATVEDKEKYSVLFFPDGSSSGERITLSGGGHVYHLQLNWLTGGITISSGNDDAG